MLPPFEPQRTGQGASPAKAGPQTRVRSPPGRGRRSALRPAEGDPAHGRRGSGAGAARQRSGSAEHGYSSAMGAKVNASSGAYAASEAGDDDWFSVEVPARHRLTVLAEHRHAAADLDLGLHAAARRDDPEGPPGAAARGTGDRGRTATRTGWTPSRGRCSSPWMQTATMPTRSSPSPTGGAGGCTCCRVSREAATTPASRRPAR